MNELADDPHLETVTRSLTACPEAVESKIPGLTLLAHADPRRVGERVGLPELGSEQTVLLSRNQTEFSPPRGDQQRPLGDPHVSRSPLRLEGLKGGNARLVTDGSSTRVTDGYGSVISSGRVFSAAEIAQGVPFVLADRVALLLHLLDPVPDDRPAFGLVGESSAITAVRADIARVADVDTPVLVRGATGTGKEVVARAIHEASRRREHPFVAVNMGALPPSLAAAELFGNVKGAFTGADRPREGHFVQAEKGTLFLDEIGESPAEVQVALLRTLQDQVVQPLGSDKARRVDVRLLAATDADLEGEIAAGRFREPLLHRLSGYEIRLPTLAERRDDVGRLVLHFLREELDAAGESARLDAPVDRRPLLPAQVVARLAVCPWPGNVRQLRNVVRQLVIANRGAAQLMITPRIEESLGELPENATPDLPSAGLLSDEEVDAYGDTVPRVSTVPLSITADGHPVLRTLLTAELVASDEPGPTPGHTPDHGAAAKLRRRHDRIVRSLLGPHQGFEVERSTGFLLLFERPADAVAFALEYHDALEELSRDGVEVQGRVGIGLSEVLVHRNSSEDVAHGARPFEIESHAPNLAERLAELATGRQTLMTRSVFDLARQNARGDHPLADATVAWMRHGERRLAANDEKPYEICEVGRRGHAPLTLPPRTLPEGEERSSETDDEVIYAVLKEHRFRVQPAARALGIPRTTLTRLIERSPRLRKPGDLSAEMIEDARQRCAGDLDAMADLLEVSRKGLSRRIKDLGLPR